MSKAEALVEFRSAECTSEKILYNSRDFKVRAKNLSMLAIIHPLSTITPAIWLNQNIITWFQFSKQILAIPLSRWSWIQHFSPSTCLPIAHSQFSSTYNINKSLRIKAHRPFRMLKTIKLASLTTSLQMWYNTNNLCLKLQVRGWLRRTLIQMPTRVTIRQWRILTRKARIKIKLNSNSRL